MVRGGKEKRRIPAFDASRTCKVVLSMDDVRQQEGKRLRGFGEQTTRGQHMNLSGMSGMSGFPFYLPMCEKQL